MADDAEVAQQVATAPVVDTSANVIDAHPIWHAIGNIANRLDPHVLLWDFAGLSILIYLFVCFSRIHRSPKYKNIDFTDLLLDKTTDTLSNSKLKLVIASIVLTWAFIYLTLDGKLTEWFTAVYIGAFLTDRITSRIYGDNPLIASGKPVSVTTTKSESTVIAEPDGKDLAMSKPNE